MSQPHRTTVEPSPDVLVQLLCQKLEEARALAIQLFTIFTLFMAMNGVLLKAWADQCNSERKCLLAILGLVLAILALGTSYFPRKIHSELVSDIQHLNIELGRPLVSEQAAFARSIEISSRLFASAVGLLWLALSLKLVT